MLTLVDKLKVSGVVLVLAFLFSPGLILTLPPKAGSTLGLFGLGFLNSRETHILSMFVHSIVIAGLMFLVLTYGPLIQNIGSTTDMSSDEPVDTVIEEVEIVAEEAVGDDEDDDDDADDADDADDGGDDGGDEGEGE
tara:strand:- start:1913 stop:2323 length:411 start_codon:yes stop_codon:yes gene_type:complete